MLKVLAPSCQLALAFLSSPIRMKEKLQPLTAEEQGGEGGGEEVRVVQRLSLTQKGQGFFFFFFF